MTLKDRGRFYCKGTFSECLCRLHYSKKPLVYMFETDRLHKLFSAASSWACVLVTCLYGCHWCSFIISRPEFSCSDYSTSCTTFWFSKRFISHVLLNLQIKTEPTDWWQKQESVFLKVLLYIWVPRNPERQKTIISRGKSSVHFSDINFIQTQTTKIIKCWFHYECSHSIIKMDRFLIFHIYGAFYKDSSEFK